jgi:hypothetical protein
MNTNAILIELLVSGFFAIACFKARAGSMTEFAMRPRDLFRLTDRLERLRRSRWQWFAMVLVLIFVRLQSHLPLVIELTAALQFVVFLSLPTYKEEKKTRGGAEARRDALTSLTSPRVSRGKA